MLDPDKRKQWPRSKRPHPMGMSWSVDGKSIYCVGDFGVMKIACPEFSEESVIRKEVFVSIDPKIRPADSEANFTQVRSSKSGKLISVCTNRGVLEVWDGEALSRRTVVTPKTPIQDAVIVANDGGIVTLHSDGSLGLWTLEKAEATSANRPR